MGAHTWIAQDDDTLICGACEQPLERADDVCPATVGPHRVSVLRASPDMRRLLLGEITADDYARRRHPAG